MVIGWQVAKCHLGLGVDGGYLTFWGAHSRSIAVPECRAICIIRSTKRLHRKVDLYLS